MFDRHFFFSKFTSANIPFIPWQTEKRESAKPNSLRLSRSGHNTSLTWFDGCLVQSSQVTKYSAVASGQYNWFHWYLDPRKSFLTKRQVPQSFFFLSVYRPPIISFYIFTFHRDFTAVLAKQKEERWTSKCMDFAMRYKSALICLFWLFQAFSKNTVTDSCWNYAFLTHFIAQPEGLSRQKVISSIFLSKIHMGQI